MPSGGQGNFAGTGGYGGQFPGFGGASAGYTGGYGNPSSVGSGTAGQTYSGQAYANTLNRYNSSLPNYSGGGFGVGGFSNTGSTAPPTAAQRARARAIAARNRAEALARRAAIEGTPAPTPAPPLNVQSGAFFPGTSTNVSPPNSGFNPGDWGSPGYGDIDLGWNNPVQQPTGGFQTNYNNFTGNPAGIGAGQINLNSAAGIGQGSGRQFGGPVAPGQQYTVGENGPETLQMNATGGGQVIPNNPADKLGGMNPQMMQAMFQLMQQQGKPGGVPQANPMVPPKPPMQPPMGQVPGGGGGFQLGDWRKRMGIEGLSRPPQKPGMGFGGSGLGVSGLMPQMRQQLG